MQDTKKKLQMLAAGILGIACLGVAGFILFQKFGSSPAPSLPPAAKSAQPTGKPKSPAKPRDTASMPREAAKEGVGKSPMLQQAQNSPSTLGELSRYRGQKVILEQQVRIAELEQRLKDLNQPARKPEIILPDLTPPKSKEKPIAAPVAAPRREAVVVSVQGVAGNLTATIRTSEGRIVTVKNGAAFGGGILQVTRKGVSIRRNGKLSAIPFE